MGSQWRTNLKNRNQRAGYSGKWHFWDIILICLALILTNPASSFALHDEKGNNELNKFFLNRNPTAEKFHNLIERLESTNNSNLFTAIDENGETVLHKAVEKFPVLNETLDIFSTNVVNFNAVDNAGNSALFTALQYGRSDSFLANLMSYGMEWETRNNNGDTALHIATLHGNLPAVSLLISLGNELNAQNVEGRTPLHQAVSYVTPSNDTIDIVRELLAYGANADMIDERNNSVLHLAVFNQNLEPQLLQIIRILIENADANPNAVDYHGSTFLQYVASQCTSNVFHGIVSYLDSINNTDSFFIPTPSGITVLHSAVRSMQVQNETLEIFKRRGVDFNARGSYIDSILNSAIIGGRSESFLNTLIAFGADWREKNEDKNTALHTAAGWGNLDAVKLFIQLGCEVNALNREGNTPLHLAFWSYFDGVTRFELVNELINHGACYDIQDESGYFPIDLAQQKLEEGKLEQGIIELLENMENQSSTTNGSSKLTNILDDFDSSNSTKIERIFQIVLTEDLLTIKGVLEHVGESINVADIWDEKLHSLLHASIKYRGYSVVENLINSQGYAKKLYDPRFNADLVQMCLRNIQRVSTATFEQKLKILQLLFANRPELIESEVSWLVEDSWMDEEGRGTPLLFSAVFPFSNGKQLELVQLLIDNNANVNATTYNATALHLAARRSYLAPQLVQLLRILIEHRADANAVNVNKNTFLHLAANSCNRTVFHEVVAYLDSVNNTNSFTMKNYEGKIVLHNAVRMMEVLNETLAIFQRRGVDLNANDDDDRSILFHAIWGARSESFLRTLIEFGANWQLKDGNGNTPLHFAAKCGNVEAVKLFIQLGIRIDARNSDGNTPLHEAFNKPGRDAPLELVKELIDQGANVRMRNKANKLPLDMIPYGWRSYLEDGVIELLQGTRVENSFFYF